MGWVQQIQWAGGLSTPSTMGRWAVCTKAWQGWRFYSMKVVMLSIIHAFSIDTAMIYYVLMSWFQYDMFIGYITFLTRFMGLFTPALMVCFGQRCPKQSQRKDKPMCLTASVNTNALHWWALKISGKYSIFFCPACSNMLKSIAKSTTMHV